MFNFKSLKEEELLIFFQNHEKFFFNKFEKPGGAHDIKLHQECMKCFVESKNHSVDLK